MLQPLVSDRLKIRVGRSIVKNETDAVAEFYQSVQQPDTAAVIFFCSSRYNLNRLGEELAQRFTCPLIGCTTAGEISSLGYQEGGIVGVSLSSSEVRIHRHTISPLSEFSMSKAQAIASSVRANLSLITEFKKQNLLGFMLIDGLSMLEDSTIASLYNCFQGVSIVGGSSGDDQDFKKTYIYDNGCFISNAAVFTIFETTLPFLTFNTQHFQPTDMKVVITGADPKRRIITEINGEPAGVEYARIIGKREDQLTSSLFSENPLLLRIGGQWHVRSISKINPDGTLTMFSAIEEGLVLTIGKGLDIIKNFIDQVRRLEEKIPKNNIFILCDCIWRKLECESFGKLPEMNDLFKELNIVGFSTYGEQFNSIHVNQTLTGVVIGG